MKWYLLRIVLEDFKSLRDSMDKYYNELEKVLFCTNPKDKLSLFSSFYAKFLAGNLDFDDNTAPKEHTKPSYAGFLTIIDANAQPKRNKLDTDEGKARFVHAILHIEYSAVDLALDHAYRFRGLPHAYYVDWLEVAQDEVRHFLMLEELLGSLGYSYGDFEAHAGLFEAQQATPTLRARMAVVPRYLEANGLDANVKMMQKLQGVGDAKAKEIVKALGVILQEEIAHVSKGDRWFLYACQMDGVDKDAYFADVAKVLPFAFYPKSFVNEAARKLAGFSDEEITKIKNGIAQ
jgi:uncharacterized ferritin-like protein (DUF455 family)